MYTALATTEFGLGAEPKRSDVAATIANTRASDYLVTGSRIQVWVSLTRLPWWSAGIGLIGVALNLYRREKANAWAKKAKEVLNADVFTNVSATYSEGGGSISIMATTTVDFSRESHAPGRVIEVLRNAGLDPVEEKWKIIQRPGGTKAAPLVNAPNPDNTSGATGPARDGANPGCGFMCALGITTPIAIAGAAILALILLRRG
jgi:hypothetical protein